MNKYIGESMKNIGTYLEEMHGKMNYGRFSGDKTGWFCRIDTRKKSYFVHYTIDEESEMFFLDVYIRCIGASEYRDAMRMLASKYSSPYNIGRVDINELTGEVSIHVECSIVGKAVTVSELYYMERVAFGTVYDSDKPSYDDIAGDIDENMRRVANGLSIKEEENSNKSDSRSSLFKLFAKLNDGAIFGNELEEDEESCCEERSVTEEEHECVSEMTLSRLLEQIFDAGENSSENGSEGGEDKGDGE